MPICYECMGRLRTKHQPNSTWYGWFDCAMPPTARIRGSQWYHDRMKESLVFRIRETIIKEETSQSSEQPQDNSFVVDDIVKTMGDLTLEDLEEEPKPVKEPEPQPEPDPFRPVQIDEKEWCMLHIKESEEWLQGPAGRQASLKDQAEKYKFIMRLKQRLYMLK